MKKFFLLAALCAIISGVPAQPPHSSVHQRPPMEQPHHNNNRHARHHGTPPAPAQPCATPEQMQLVIQTLKAQSFDDKKVEIAELCVTIGHFCTDDLSRMAAEMSFDDSRLAFLQYAYTYCTDKENYPMLHDSFAFQSNFEKLMDAVRPPRR